MIDFRAPATKPRAGSSRLVAYGVQWKRTDEQTLSGYREWFRRAT
jgi:hypothetical protein